MRLQRHRPPCTCYSIYVRECEKHAKALAAEIATWPEPIDVIRAGFGLPERWRLRVRKAAAANRLALAGIAYTHLDFSALASALNGPERCPRHA